MLNHDDERAQAWFHLQFPSAVTHHRYHSSFKCQAHPAIDFPHPLSNNGTSYAIMRYSNYGKKFHPHIITGGVAVYMLRAIIFDCDGVLADTERIHWAAFNEVLRKYDAEMTWDEYTNRYLAYDDPTCFRTFLRDIGRDADDEFVKQLVAEKRALLRKRAEVQKLTGYPGVVPFIRAAAKRYPLAVASGAARNEIQMVLDALDVADCFTVIISADDVERGKPNPEPFLTAMMALNSVLQLTPPLEPTHCLVVEDSIHGVRAAKVAGMWCLAVTNTYPAEQLATADWIVEQLEPGLLERLAREI